MSFALSRWLAVEGPPTLRMPARTRSEIDEVVARRLRQVLTAAHGSDFNRERIHRAGGLRDGSPEPLRLLQDLIPATKQALTQAGSAALVGGRTRPEWRSTRSSGSTGEPFRVYFDPRSWAVSKYLIKWRARSLAGARVWDRLAVLDAIPLESNASNPLARLGRFRTVSVLQSRDRIAHAIAEFEPAVIYGPPSAVADLADVAPEWPGVETKRLVFTSGEPLQLLVRQHLESTWGCQVRDIYGTSETKEIAFECSRGALHINEDSVLVEILDDKGRPMTPGLEGRIVVTSLVNLAMPLLRYVTGDRGALMEAPCGCGLPFRCLGLVSGRSVDVLTFGGGMRLSPYALTVAIEGTLGLRRYQIIQTAPDHLRVRAVTAPGTDLGRVASEIEQALVRATGGLATASVEFLPELTRDPDRKFRVVQRALEGPGL